MLVDDIVTAVRESLDEDSTADITPGNILRALNRGQQKLVRLAARKYPALFKREVELTVTGRTAEIPEYAFGLTVNEVDVIVSGVAYKVEPAQLNHLTGWDSTSSTSTVPQYYAQQGNTLRFYPSVSGTTARVRYQLRPPELVVSQGRITGFALGSAASTLALGDGVFLDALGSELTTSIAALKAFVNWVDGTTGLVKATLQVNSLDTTNKIVTFKTTGLDRTTVFGQTVSTTLPTTDGTLDDYLCIANGTCVPTTTSDYADYLTQFAVVDIKRKGGEPAAEDIAALAELQSDVETMWSGRALGTRVKPVNPYWGRKTSLLNRYR